MERTMLKVTFLALGAATLLAATNPFSATTFAQGTTTAPGAKTIGDPNTIGDQNLKPGDTGLPYIEKRKTAKRQNPRMQAPPEPDKPAGVNPPDGDMPVWARALFGRDAGGGGGGGGGR